jgi:uncharacterized DUF497 family protein
MGADWDPRKDAATRRRRGIDFEEAASVADDPLAMVELDRRHSGEEDRHSLVGWSREARLLAVTVAYRGDTIRVISARRATKRERHAYTQR